MNAQTKTSGLRKEFKLRLAKGAIASFAMNCSGAVLNFMLAIILARLLGAQGYGIYAGVLAVASICVPFALLGIDFLFVRFVSAYTAKAEYGLLRGLLQTGTGSVVAASSFIGFLLFIFAIVQNVFSEQFSYGLILGAILVPLFSVTVIMQSALQGLQKIALSQISSNIVRPAIIGSAVIAISLFATMTSTIALFMAVLSAGISLALSILLAYRSINSKTFHTPMISRRAYWLKNAIPFLLFSGAYMVITQTDLLMVGGLLNSKAAGIYAATTKIAMLVIFGMNAVGAIFGPLVAEAYHLKKMDDVKHLMRTGIIWSLAFALPVAVLLIAGQKHVLALFGVEFGAGALTLTILVFAQLLNAAAGPIGFVLTMTGHQKYAAKILWLAAGVSILLNAVLIPVIGLAGAAVASVTTTIFWNLLMMRYAQKKFKLPLFTTSR